MNKEIEYKAKKFYNLKSMELELLEELEDNTENKSSIIYNGIENLFSRGLELYLIIKKLGDTLIIKDKRHYYLIYDFKEDINEGEFWGLHKDRYDDLFKFKFKINEDLLDEEFLNEYSNKSYDLGDDFEEEEMNKEMIKTKLEELKKIDEEERKREDEEEEENRRLFNEESIGDFSNYEVNKKEIMQKGYAKDKIFKLNKNVNEIFDFEIIENNRFGFHQISGINSFETYLLENLIIYEKFVKDKKLYGITYKEKSIFLNKILIPKNKIGFIFNKMREDTSDEQIKLLKKLTGMKLNLLKVKNICLNFGGKSKHIDIEIILEKADIFKVKFMNKEKITNWNFLKDIFFYGGTSRSLNNDFSGDKLFKFGDEFGLNKKEIFIYLKRVLMLEEIKE